MIQGKILSPEELRAARLRYLNSPHMNPVSSHVHVIIDDADASPLPAAVSAEVNPAIILSSSSSSSLCDESSDEHREPPVPLLPSSRKRDRPQRPPPRDIPQGLLSEFSSSDLVKQALKAYNPSCVPLLRSSQGKYIRFGCKHGSSSIPCPLNVSGVRNGNSVKLSPSTYTAGDCSNRICTNCQENCSIKLRGCLVPCSFVPCPNNHRFCLECFDHIVLSQVRTDKPSFLASQCRVLCKFCVPDSVFDIQAHCKCLPKATWEFYLEALSESAVIAEQEKWQQKKSNEESGASDTDISFVGDLVCRICPSCKRYMADDFEGCLALKCGRLVGATGGCGAEFCAYCDAVFASEIEVHQHLRHCDFNPRPGEIFPGRDYKQIVWQRRRERVWYHVVCNAADQIPNIWSKIAHGYPELDMTPEWLAQRTKWLEIAAEFQLSTAEFAALVPKYTYCFHALMDMGFGHGSGHDEESLLRAIILNKGDHSKSVLTLLDNT